MNTGKNLYTVKVNGKIELESVTAKEAAEYIGVEQNTVRKRGKEGGMICGKYIVVLVGKKDKKEAKGKKENPVKIAMTKNLYSEWEEVCAKFKNVKWEKVMGHGVKKLSV